MLIDCQTCAMRDLACGECVVTMLLGPIPQSLEVHRSALTVLAEAGIVAPLRLIKGQGQPEQACAACQ
jgi:hypothetical protein